MSIITSVEKISSVFDEHSATAIFAGIVFVNESTEILKEETLESLFASTNFPLID